MSSFLQIFLCDFRLSKFISKYLSTIISVSKLNCLVNIIKQNFKCGVIAGANNTKKLTIDSNEKKYFSNDIGRELKRW